MAEGNPLYDVMVAEGRLKIVPYAPPAQPVTYDINFDALYTSLNRLVAPCYAHWDPLLTHYAGTRAESTVAVTADVSHMITFALWSLYNRLRAISETLNCTIRTARMRPRAPVPTTVMYPAYLCGLLNGIGWLTVDDLPVQFPLQFVAGQGTGTHYGRTIAQRPNSMAHERLITHLRACGVTMSSIDLTPSPGTWWPTCRVERLDGLTNVMGTFHKSHYTEDDAFFSTVLAPGEAALPFQDFSSTAERGYDAATRTALATYCGGATVDRADPQGGRTYCYTCYLMRDASEYEINSVLLAKFRS